MLSGLHGEDSIAELCRKKGIAQSLYSNWSKEKAPRANPLDIREQFEQQKDLQEAIGEVRCFAVMV